MSLSPVVLLSPTEKWRSISARSANCGVMSNFAPIPSNGDTPDSLWDATPTPPGPMAVKVKSRFQKLRPARPKRENLSPTGRIPNAETSRLYAFHSPSPVPLPPEMMTEWDVNLPKSV